jgi:hypothetical protein
MTSVQEALAHAEAEQASKDIAKKREQAKPTMSLLHHIAATQAIGTGFTVTLLDGTSYKAAKGDFVFTDGLETLKQLQALSADEFINRMNHKMACQARKFVYGLDDSHLSFVSERLGRMESASPGDAA